MSTGLPTIWALVAGGAATLPEPFSRAALINWIHARRPDVGVTSISTHIQLATANAAHPDDSGRHRHRPPVRVADLFQSAGFARARHHAASSGMPWFVLSDRHGLLEPDDVVAPLRPRAGGLLDARRRRLRPAPAAAAGPPRRGAGAPVAGHVAGGAAPPVAGRG